MLAFGFEPEMQLARGGVRRGVFAGVVGEIEEDLLDGEGIDLGLGGGSGGVDLDFEGEAAPVGALAEAGLNTAKAVVLSGSSFRSDQITYKVAAKPAHGALTGTPPNLTYIPEKGFQGMDRLTFTATDGLTTSPPASVDLLVGTGGTGLKGCYYDNKEFTTLKATQLDRAVDFDWGSEPPAKTLAAGPFSVRWAGQVLAPESGTYRFSTRTGDGARLWINGVQVIDDWNDHTTKLWNDSAEITLTAGQKYSLKMECYHSASPATARLYWYMPSRKACSIIPQELLYPVAGVILTSPSNGASFGPPATVTLTADTADVPGKVTKVAFYDGDTLIGSATTAPYSMIWKDVPAGSHRLTAKAAGGNGQVSTSTMVVIAVDGETVPVTSGLACWYDASYGLDTDANAQVRIWNDRSGNGHHGVFREHNHPAQVPNQLGSRPAVRFGGECSFDVGGKFFVREQYVVVRSPSPIWSGYGSFLGRTSGRASSYMLASVSTGFDEDQFPEAVSRNGSPVALERSGRIGYNLGTITDFMVLKITANSNDTNAKIYQIGGIDHQWQCKFDVAEILGYSRPLTAPEEASVGGYLAAKYGIKTAYPQPSKDQPADHKAH